MATRETPTHSPAPWRPDEDGNIVDTNENLVVVVSHCPAEDRRLILKSPELLDVVRRYVRLCEDGEDQLRDNPILFYIAMKALVDYIDGGGE